MSSTKTWLLGCRHAALPECKSYDPHAAEALAADHRQRRDGRRCLASAYARASVRERETNEPGLSLSRGSTRTTPSAGTEVAATGRTIPSARALRRKAGVRISAAPSSTSLALSPTSKRARTGHRTSTFALAHARAALLQCHGWSSPSTSVAERCNSSLALVPSRPGARVLDSPPPTAWASALCITGSELLLARSPPAGACL